MQKAAIFNLLVESGALGIIRVDHAQRLIRIAEAVRKGGLSCIEITMTTPGALRAIEEASSKLEEVIIGAGTVLDGPTARQAILAGAQFLVSPTVKPDVVEIAHRYGIVVIAGAMTPTEILTAWELGADMVKVFPANALGPGYLKAVHGPLPQIPLVPTGGVNADTASDFIKAGAAVVCAGSWLVGNGPLDEGDYEGISRRAGQLMKAVEETREVE